jgi:hypothetical protein
MDFIRLHHEQEQMAASLVGEFPDRKHVDIVLDDDTTMTTRDGEIKAVFLRNVIPHELYKHAYRDWKRVKGPLSNQVDVVGTTQLPRSKNRAGIPSPRWGVYAGVLKDVKGRQGRLGWDGPGHPTPLTLRHPEMLDRNRRVIERVDSIYAEFLPTYYAIQRAAVEQMPDSRLWKTVCTTVYVIRNHRCAYHRDSGNLLGVMSCLMPMGKFTGGELALPRWRIAIAFKPGDLLLFDPQQVHGNLPLEGERLSAAFYCARWIADCGK